MTVRVLLLLRGVELDDVVNAQNGRGGLGGKLEALDLAHGGLEHAGLDVVANDALVQVEAHVLQRGLALVRLARGVVRAQLGNNLGRVNGAVDGERLGGDEERVGKLGDGELLARAL